MEHDVLFPDGQRRCHWVSASDSDYIRYHDHEWGNPIVDSKMLFERLSLEGFQAGLSWLTVLRKRDAFREVFSGFDPDKVALYSAQDVERLLADARIIRHRGKIEAVINNAQRYLDMQANGESLAALIWSFEPASQAYSYGRATSEESIALSKALRQRGWKFVGPTTMYAMMQAVGMVNDHAQHCYCRQPLTEQRAKLLRPT